MSRQSKKKIFSYAAVSGLLIFLLFLGWFSPLGAVLVRPLQPILRQAGNLGFAAKSFLAERQESGHLLEANRRLEAELEKNLVDRSRILILEDENRILRDSLGFLARRQLDFTIANVLSRGGIGESLGRVETIALDKGENDGISEGQALVNSDGIVVGKISAVKAELSQAMLSNNDNCKLAATILGGEKTSGVVRGDLGLAMKMEFIPQSIAIKEGDIVVTSGLEEKIPRGLVIGQVRKVERGNNELWQTAMLDPLFDKEDLVIVSVVSRRD